MQHPRLFFGIGLSPANRREISQWLETTPLPGKPVHLQDLHLTLAFIGSLEPAKLAPLCWATGRLAPAPAFNLDFTRLSHWQRSGILSLTTETVPAPLCQLQRQLADLVAAFGRPPDHRRYRPHITLARHARRPLTHLPAGPALPLRVNDFALYRSHPNDPPPRYEIVQRWPLIQPEPHDL